MRAVGGANSSFAASNDFNDLAEQPFLCDGYACDSLTNTAHTSHYVRNRQTETQHFQRFENVSPPDNTAHKPIKSEVAENILTNRIDAFSADNKP